MPDPIWARVGTLGSAREPVVDPKGVVAPDGASGRWWIDWWIGADDRWHLASAETAVRQSTVGGAPVIETRVRIPGGDAVQRTYGFLGTTGQELLVIEVENDSAVPFALALVVRSTGPGAIAGGHVVLVDGVPRLLFGRPPARHAMWDDGDDGDQNAAFVFPVPHRTAFRAVVVVDQDPNQAEVTWPAAVPEPDQVARGWAAQADRGARLALPSPFGNELGMLRRQLLLFEPGFDLVPTYDELGYPDVAEDRLGSALTSDDRPGEDYLHGLATHWLLTRDDALVKASQEAVERAVVAGRGRSVRALTAAATLFEVLGDRRAADDCRRVLRRSKSGHEPAAPNPFERARDLIDAARQRGATWPYTVERPWLRELLGHLRAVLVDDRDLHELNLLPGWSAEWFGQQVDVADLPTGAGPLSYAVRWHGERPALLWELRLHPGVGPVQLTAPALDPTWVTEETSGETLLAAAPARQGSFT